MDQCSRHNVLLLKKCHKEDTRMHLHGQVGGMIHMLPSVSGYSDKVYVMKCRNVQKGQRGRRLLLSKHK